MRFLRGREPAKEGEVSVGGIAWISILWMIGFVLISLWLKAVLGLVVALLGILWIGEGESLRLSAERLTVIKGIRRKPVPRSALDEITLRHLLGFYWIGIALTASGEKLRLPALSYPIVWINGRIVRPRTAREMILEWQRGR